jgi:hypothetical protein
MLDNGKWIRFRLGREILGGASEGRLIDDRCRRKRKNADAVKKDGFTRPVVIISHINVLGRCHRVVIKAIFDWK